MHQISEEEELMLLEKQKMDEMISRETKEEREARLNEMMILRMKYVKSAFLLEMGREMTEMEFHDFDVKRIAKIIPSIWHYCDELKNHEKSDNRPAV